jgi:hypothetical protein
VEPLVQDTLDRHRLLFAAGMEKRSRSPGAAGRAQLSPPPARGPTLPKSSSFSPPATAPAGAGVSPRHASAQGPQVPSPSPAGQIVAPPPGSMASLPRRPSLQSPLGGGKSVQWLLTEPVSEDDTARYLALLKKGLTLKKYGRSGKPRIAQVCVSPRPVLSSPALSDWCVRGG